MEEGLGISAGELFWISTCKGLDEFAEAAALKTLHGEIGDAFVLANAVDGNNRWVLETRDAFDLASKASPGLGKCHSPGRISLSATSRPRDASCARKTTPMPPPPRRSIKVKSPKRSGY